MKKSLTCIFIILVATIQMFAVEVSAARPDSTLKLTIMHNNLIRLEWEGDTDIQGYMVERRIGNGNYSTIATLSRYVKMYNVYNILPGNFYTFRIRAIDASGNSYIYTDEKTVNTQELFYPVDLKLTPVSASQIDINVIYPMAVNHVTIIERKKINEKDWEQIAYLADGNTSFRDENLLENTIYFYRAKAVFGPDVETSYYPSSYGTSTSTLIHAPENLYGHPISEKIIYLQWDMKTSNTNFIIERKENDGEFQQIAVTGLNVKTWYDGFLNEGSVYTYRIKAKKGGSESAYTDEFEIRLEYISPPENIKAVGIGGTTIDLSWLDNKNLEGVFELWRKEGNSGNWELITILPGNIREYQDTGLKPNTTYTYRVRVYVDYKKAWSAYTESPQVRTINYYPPTNVRYVILSEKNIRLTWGHGSVNRSGYVVERRTEEGPWVTLGTVVSGATYFNDTTLSPNTKYYYRIKVYSNNLNMQAYSDVVEVCTGLPGAPDNLTASVLSPRLVSLKWINNMQNEQGFVVERRRNNGQFIRIATLDAGASVYMDYDVESSTNYAYRVRAYNRTGYGNWSKTVYLQTPKAPVIFDVDKEHAAYDAIDFLVSMGIIKLNKNGAFEPERNISRAEFVSLVVRGFNIEEHPVGSFPDVTYGKWYHAEVMSAANAGIITGDEYNMFRPDMDIKREDMAVILCRVLQLTDLSLEYTKTEILDDVKDSSKISPYARESIAQLMGQNLIMTDEKGNINPHHGVSRAEAAMVIYKLIAR